MKLKEIKNIFRPDRHKIIVTIFFILISINLFFTFLSLDLSIGIFLLAMLFFPGFIIVNFLSITIWYLSHSYLTQSAVSSIIEYFFLASLSAVFYYILACLFLFHFRKKFKKGFGLLYKLLAIVFLFSLASVMVLLETPTQSAYPAKYQIELTDSFCINGNQAVIFVRNMGTQAFSPSSEITVMNATSGTKVDVTWSTVDGTPLSAGNLEPGKVGRASTTCPSGTLCVYRVTSAYTGRSIRASVQC